MVGFLRLVPLMGDADLASDTAAMRQIKSAITGEQGKSMAALLAVFIARQFDKSIAQAIVQEVFMSTELLDESPLYREWVERAEAKGALLGMRTAAHLVLEARFGPLDPALLAALAADEALLTDVISHSATYTLEQVRERLYLAA